MSRYSAMSAPVPTTPVIRFGVYEADLRAGELRKQGIKVRLQEQPFQILVMLLEKPGEVVTREDLRQRLWPADTFVDFDHSVNTAVKKLREALGDDADNPRFVETLPRRGYRFLAPVGEAGRVSQGPGAATPAETGAAFEHAAPAPVLEENVTVRTLLVVVAVFAVLVAGLLMWRGDSPAGPQAALPEMQVVPFTTAAGDEFLPAFSPDGKQIAYAATEGGGPPDLYVQVVGTASPLRLTNTPAAAEAHPTWSPDGRYLAFMRYEVPAALASKKKAGPESQAESSLVVIPVLGGAERVLLSVSETVGLSAWSPDGRYLAISVRPAAQQPYGIYLFSLETLEKQQLTDPGPRTVGDFAGRFSPDGRQIAFLRNTRETTDLYVVSVEGGEPRRVTFENAVMSGLDWTADGKQFIYSSFRGGGNPVLWRVPISGGEPQRLGVGGDGTSAPAVAPRGNRLAYVQIRWNEDISRIPVPGPGGRARPATPLIATTRNEEGPQYSPDGKKIAFQSTRSGYYEIWVCDADGSNPLQVTSFRGPLTGSPRWSPDGKRLAFDSRPGSNAQIYTIEAQAGVPRQLTSGAFNHVVPSWSRDGKWIYFASDRAGGWQVWKMPTEGGPALQVTRQGGFAAFESFDGKTLYYAKGIDLPGVWRVPVEGGEEVQALENPPGGFWGYWALYGDGIFYLRPEPAFEDAVPGKQPRPVVEFLSFATGKKREIARPEKNPYYGAPGLAVTPDGSALLYLQVAEQSSDIMLVENFR